MREYEKMRSGQFYNAADSELAQMRLLARQRTHTYNLTPPEAYGESPSARHQLLEQIFGQPLKSIVIEPPFAVDYGINTTIKGDFYANFGLVILDCAPVEIGEGCLFGPHVQILTASHPLDPVQRAALVEFAKPIVIGKNVWLGAGAIVAPGITIGEGCVIGAGSVVTKDIPAFSLAVGNPCRVKRSVLDSDKG